jgi:UDPglucose 6-dehydrogenase
VAIKSTVPVGTTDAMQRRLHRLLSHRRVVGPVPVLGNPEFLREGTATRDFLCPDRIIVGARRRRDAALLRHAFAPLVDQGVPFIVMRTRSAELAKYAANTMLAARISFINEMADIAEATGADIEEVRSGIGTDSRIGPAFLRAGIGYGGSCFPKDVSSLQHQARELGLDPRVLDAVALTNAAHLRWPVERLARELGGAWALKGLRAAVWGLAFKPGTDDLRAAASLVVVKSLLEAGADVRVYDPVAMRHAVQALPAHPALHCAASAADALAGADVMLLLTEWPEFVDFPPQRAAAALRGNLVLDGRNVLPAERWAAAGLRVLQVGRPAPGFVARRQAAGPDGGRQATPPSRPTAARQAP